MKIQSIKYVSVILFLLLFLTHSSSASSTEKEIKIYGSFFGDDTLVIDDGSLRRVYSFPELDMSDFRKYLLIFEDACKRHESFYEKNYYMKIIHYRNETYCLVRIDSETVLEHYSGFFEYDNKICLVWNDSKLPIQIKKPEVKKDFIFYIGGEAFGSYDPYCYVYKLTPNGIIYKGKKF